MLNQVIVQGRLVKDPEIRYTNSKKAVADLRIAVDRDYKNADGERGCDFFGVVAFGGTAEHVVKFYKKGSPIIVRGRMQQEQWKAKDGTNRETVEILAENVYFCEGKKSETNSPLPNERVTFTDIPEAESGDLPF